MTSTCPSCGTKICVRKKTKGCVPTVCNDCVPWETKAKRVHFSASEKERFDKWINRHGNEEWE